MATLTIEGRSVTIDDAFLHATPEQQEATVNEIAQSLKLTPGSAARASGPTLGSVARQIPAGFNAGLADVLGSPVDGMTRALNNDIHDINAAARAVGLTKDDGRLIDDIQNPFGGSQSIKRGMSKVGVPDPDDTPARNPEERVARGVGEGAAGMLAPELAGTSLVKAAPAAADAIASLFGRSKSLRDLASNAAVGGVAGGSGQTAAEFAPDEYKPVASMAGSLVGGGAAAVTAQGPRAVAESTRGLRDYVDPLTEAGQQRAAAARLASNASSPRDVIDTIETRSPEIVPGSRPTTFQLTGDMGLGGLEREVQTRNPVEFAERRAEQNAARVDALQGVQPGGKPEELSSFLRTRLADIDKAGNEAIENATRRAQTATADIGGNQSPEFYGAAIQDRTAPRQAQLTQDAQGAVRRLGGEGTPEGYGASLRSALQSAEDSARAHERSLWNAVDPDNTLTVGMQPIRTAANRVYGNLTAAAQAGLEPTERTILQVVNGYGGTERFRELADLRSAVSSAMRNELGANGRSPAYGRLSQFRGAIEDAIGSAVEQRAAAEAEAVVRGELAPEQTTLGRLQREADEFIAARRTAARTSAGSSAVGDGGTGSAGFSRTSGAQVSGRRGSEDAPRDQGLQGTKLPTFDQAARERLAAATDATRERAQTFGQGPVGQTLKTLGTRGNYRMPDGAVPQNIFKAGATGFESVRAFRNAVGDHEDAISALRNYAAASLRQEAERPDGTLDPNRYTIWTRKFQGALRAVPEVRDAFSTAARASEQLHNFTPFRADIAPSTIPEQFFHSGPSGFEGVNQLRSLIGDLEATTVLNDYAASQVRKAAARPDGVLDPAKLDRWQRTHADALRALPGLSDRFATAAKATEAIEQAATARRQAVEAYQDGAIGRVLGHTEPSDISREVGAIFGRRDAAAAMTRLASRARQNPEAIDGLRRAAVDFMYGRFVGNTEAATSGIEQFKPDAFQTFVRSNEAPLKAIFSEAEYNVLRAISADLKRSNRSLNAVRIPGQSNTAQDTAKMIEGKPAAGLSLLAKLMGAVGAGYGTYGVMGAGAGAIGVLGQTVLSSAREAGLSRVNDLVKQAMLDPQLARTLLMKAPERPNSGSAMKLAQQLRRLTMFASAAGAQHDGKRE
jgi:hypothetical protein